MNRLSRAHERYRRQTDGRATANSEREREFTFAKNRTNQKYVSRFSPNNPSLYERLERFPPVDSERTGWLNVACAAYRLVSLPPARL